MFKTDDRVTQICLFLAGLIFMFYAGIMAFNTGFFIDRYPTFENDVTNRYFIVWFGLNNIMFLSYLVSITWGTKVLIEDFLFSQYQHKY